MKVAKCSKKLERPSHSSSRHSCSCRWRYISLINLFTGLRQAERDLVRTPGNVSKLALGIGVGALTALFDSGTFALGFIVLGIETAVIVLTSALLPVGWALKPFDQIPRV